MKDPKELAAEYVKGMTAEEKERVRQFAAGDYEDRIIADPMTEDWTTRENVACLDEIDRLCGYSD